MSAGKIDCTQDMQCTENSCHSVSFPRHFTHHAGIAYRLNAFQLAPCMLQSLIDAGPVVSERGLRRRTSTANNYLLTTNNS